MRQRGFTIIELMLAMAFLTFVLLFVSLSMVQMLRGYDKGVTIKQINQAGRTLTEDLARSVRTASSTQEVITDKVDLGVICVGNIAYVWNPVYRQNKTYQNVNRYTFNAGGGNPAEQIGLARVYVPNPQGPSSVCQSAAPATTFFFTRNADNYTLLSPRSRITWASVDRSADGKAMKLTFYLGTYDTNETGALQAGNFADVYSTPYFPTAASAEPQCRDGQGAEFCFVTPFSVTVYLPNAVN